jgi:serine protease inhibitor
MKSGIEEISQYYLSESESTRNIVFSPFNIFSGIKLMQLAASGQARNELNNAFGNGDFKKFVDWINRNSEGKFILENCNRIFYRQLKGEVFKLK